MGSLRERVDPGYPLIKWVWGHLLAHDKGEDALTNKPQLDVLSPQYTLTSHVRRQTKNSDCFVISCASDDKRTRRVRRDLNPALVTANYNRDEPHCPEHSE